MKRRTPSAIQPILRPRTGLRALLAGAVLLLLALLGQSHAALAQESSFSTQIPFGRPSQGGSAVAIGDLDGDGDLDLVVGVVDGPNAVYLNDGRGGFSRPGAERLFGGSTERTHALALGDLNGDGHLDIAVANDGLNRIYLNDGRGNFGGPENALPLGTEEQTSQAIALGDLDGNGFLDVVVGNSEIRIRREARNDQPLTCDTQCADVIYFNDGSGAFTNADQRQPLGAAHANTTDLLLADMDGDGLLDILTAGGSSWHCGAQCGDLLYLNDGARFTGPMEAANLGGPSTKLALAWMPPDGPGDARRPALLANRGIPEVLLLDVMPEPAGPPAIAYDIVILPEQEVADVAWGDVNGDGLPDAVAVRIDIATMGRSGLFLGAGMDEMGLPTFANPLSFGNAGDLPAAVALADLNGDDLLDVVEINAKQNVVHLADSRLAGAQGGYLATPLGAGRIAATGDLDGDGLLDMVIAGDGDLWVELTDPGAGGSYAMPTERGDLTQLIIADLDGDGALDLLAGHAGYYDWECDCRVTGPVTLYRNDGRGDFTLPDAMRTMGAPGLGDVRLAVGDLNADDSLDVVVVRHAVYDDGCDCSTGASSRIYFNDGLGNFGGPGDGVAFGDGKENQTVAVGDMDGDGDLDLVVGRLSGTLELGAADLLLRNDGAGNFPADGHSVVGAVADATYSLLLADVDGNSTLDVVSGGPGRNLVHLNDGAGFFPTTHSFGDNVGFAFAMAAGDLDGDGDLDLVTGVDNGDAVYMNDGQGRFPSALRRTIWASPDGLASYANDYRVADMDGDGILDILVTRYEGVTLFSRPAARSPLLANNPPHVTLTRPTLAPAAPGFSTPQLLTDTVISVPYTLYDAEGDPVPQVQLYYSLDGGGAWRPATPTTATVTTNLGTLGSAALFDGMDDLLQAGGPDLAGAEQVTLEAWVLPTHIDTAQIILAQEPHPESGHGLVLRLHADCYEIGVSGPQGDPVLAIPLPPEDLGAWVHLAAVYDGVTWILYHNGQEMGRVGGAPFATGGPGWWMGGLPDGAPTLAGAVDEVRIWTRARSAAEIRAQATALPALTDPDLAAYWRFNGSRGPTFADLSGNGNALAPLFPETMPGSVAAGAPGVYHWDTFRSGFFGRSDNVVLRMEAREVAAPPEEDAPPPPTPAASSPATPAPILYPNGLPPAGQRTAANAVTDPLRVRGTQVRVFAETPPTGTVDAGLPPSRTATITPTISARTPVTGAVVFRIPAGRRSGGSPLGTDLFAARTDAGGYLQGRGAVGVGDRLVALAPQWDTGALALYHTSADPTAPAGEYGTPVTRPGIQELTVSAGNPLYLFDLSLSLEWDARNDGAFLADLQEAVRRAGELLWHVTEGQMTLGDVAILQERTRWLDVDTVIFASSTVRPRATMGGLLGAPMSEVITVTAGVTVTNGITRSVVLTREIADAYTPGQIRMGPNWDPFSANRADLTQDWQRALAHEFGHYFLFLPDNYLGYNDQGAVVANDCLGSFMTSAYDPAYSQFLARRPAQGPLQPMPYWDVPADPAANACLRSVAQRLTGRSDWETIQRFYPAVDAAPNPADPAPQPLDLVRFTIFEPSAAAETLPARNFDLRAGSTGERRLVTQGQAYLFKPRNPADPLDGDTVINLGSVSRSDRVMVRGARDGDRVCVFAGGDEPPLAGCTGDMDARSVLLQPVVDWRPDLLVAPVEVTTGDAVITSTVTVTTTAGITESRVLSRAVTLFKPAMAVTVTLSSPVDGPLSAQMLSYYGSPFPGWPELSPVVELTPLDAATPLTFTGVITLDYPLFSGFIRVWPGLPADDPLRQALVDPTTAGRQFVTDVYVTARCGPDQSGVWCPAAYTGGPLEQRPGTLVDDRNNGGGANYSSSGGGANYSSSGGGANYSSSGGGANYSSSGGGANYSSSGGGADYRAGAGANFRGWGANQRMFGANVASSDGQVTIFNNWNFLGDPGVDSLQTLPTLEQLPPALTLVGNGYRVALATTGVERTIAFNYLQRETPDGYEHTLAVYFLPDKDTAAGWRKLATELDQYENLATAPLQGPGIYALAAVVEIPLTTAGWNLVAYPLPEMRPVDQALASVAYTTVVGFQADDALDPWKIYDPGVPAWVNDLDALFFGQGYWILIPEPATLQLRVPTTPTLTTPSVAAPDATLIWRTPPAVYYGAIQGPAQVVRAGAELRAWVGDTLCGRAAIQADPAGGFRYVLKVAAAEPGAKNRCGIPGAPVTVSLGETPAMQPATPAAPLLWTNERIRQVDLVAGGG